MYEDIVISNVFNLNKYFFFFFSFFSIESLFDIRKHGKWILVSLQNGKNLGICYTQIDRQTGLNLVYSSN